MSRIRLSSALALLIAAGWSPASAQPDIRQVQILEGLRLFRDAVKPAVFYYEPGDLELAREKDGKPDFQFLDMRYTGHRSADDQGTNRFRSLLRFRVVLTPHSQAKMERVKESLMRGAPRAELRPLPIRRLDAILVCTAGTTDTLTVGGGHFERPDSTPAGDRGAQWKERTFVLKMDPNEADLLRGMFTRQQVAISVGYAYFADCVAWNATQISLSGSPGAVAAAREFFGLPAGGASDSTSAVRPVKVNAFEITVDAQRWPDLLARSDINEQLQPEYALLDVYCFDFANNIRPDLYAKKVSVEASGVSGKTVRAEITFSPEEPDRYAQSARFPFAVRIDRPFRYRVVEINQDGEKTESAWIERTSWTAIVDVTTPASDPRSIPSSGQITR